MTFADAQKLVEQERGLRSKLNDEYDFVTNLSRYRDGYRFKDDAERRTYDWEQFRRAVEAYDKFRKEYGIDPS